MGLRNQSTYHKLGESEKTFQRRSVKARNRKMGGLSPERVSEGNEKGRNVLGRGISLCKGLEV